MKFTLCVVVLTIMVSVDAVPAPAIELPATDPGFFKKKLDSVQGAIKDSIRAGMDLQIMEGKLKAIVAASSFFWMTESATEYATAKNAYANGWKDDKPGKHTIETFTVKDLLNILICVLLVILTFNYSYEN